MIPRCQSDAVHEAGHAVVAVLLGRCVRTVSLRPGGSRMAGQVRCSRHPRLDLRGASNRFRTRRYIEREIMIAWAGLAAESLLKGRKTTDGAGEDAEMIVDLLRRLARDAKERVELGRTLFDRTVRLLDHHWSAVRRVAEALQCGGTLSGAELRRLVHA